MEESVRQLTANVKQIIDKVLESKMEVIKWEMKEELDNLALYELTEFFFCLRLRVIPEHGKDCYVSV